MASDTVGAGHADVRQEDNDDAEWAFSANPMNLLFGEPPSFHGDPETPYVYLWPAESPLAHRPPLRALLPDSSVHLMAHHVWESCIKMSDWIVTGRIPVQGKSVLELGAGSALPSMAALAAGARVCVVTDFPEEAILEGIRQNIVENVPDCADRSRVEGCMWGEDTEHLHAARRECDQLRGCVAQGPEALAGFDVILVADCLYWRNVHRELLETCRAALRPDCRGRIYLSFQYHNTAPDDFFRLAVAEFGFKVKQLARIDLAWSGIDIEYEPDTHEGADGIGYIRGPVYMYEMY